MQNLNCAIRRLFGCLAICVALFVMGSGLGAGSGWSKTAPKPPAAPVPEKTELGGKAMDFTVIRLSSDYCEPNCPEWIAAEGEITMKTPAKLAKLLANPAYRKLPIMLNSPGGAVYAAMDMGQLIRKYGMNTAVALSNTRDCSDLNKLPNCLPGTSPVHLGNLNEYNAYCNSACSWMQLAGVVRIVGAGSELGLHQPHSDYQPWIDHYWDTWRMVNGVKHIISHKFIKRTYLAKKHEVGVQKSEMPKYLAYIKQMGGSPDILVEMDKASPKDLNEFNHGNARLKELGLVTDETLNVNALVSTDHCKTSGKLSSNCVTLTPQQYAALQPKPLPTPPVTPAPAGTAGQAPASTAMTFTVTRLMSDACSPRCVEWIAADGDITSDTPAKLQKLLDSEQNRKLPIILNSAGGNGDAAMALGRLIHKYRMDTAVAATSINGCATLANCASQGPGGQPGLIFTAPSRCDDACTLVLLGGALRIADNDVHISVRPAESDLPWSDSQRTKYKAYLKELNIPSDIMVEFDYGSYHPSNDIAGDKRQALGLISNSKISLARLVSGGHCDNANTFVSNCIVEKVVTPVKTAAPPPAPLADKPGDMTFSVVRLASQQCKDTCPGWIAASGNITPNTSGKLSALLMSYPAMRKLPILLQSYGGDQQAAMEMGRLIHSYGLVTIVSNTTFRRCPSIDTAGGGPNCTPGISGKVYEGYAFLQQGYCKSACVLMLMGARTSVVGSGTPLQAFQSGVVWDGPTREKFTTYIRDMGAKPGALDMLMGTQVPSKLGYVTNEELQALGLVGIIDEGSSAGTFIGPALCKDNIAINCLPQQKPALQTVATP